MDPLRTSVDKMMNRMNQRHCLVAKCVRYASPGYVLCKQCREQWKLEIEDRAAIPDKIIGMLHD